MADAPTTVDAPLFDDADIKGTGAGNAPAPGDDDNIDILRDVLQDLGVVIPDTMSDDDLVAAIKTAVAPEGNMPKVPADAPTVKEEPHTLVMSLDAVKDKDPLTLALARNGEASSRSAREQRIGELEKRGLPKAAADELRNELKVARFSISGESGEFSHPVDRTLKTLEMSLPSSKLTDGHLSKHAVAQPHPSDMGNGMTAERAAQVAAEQAKNSGIRKQKPA